VSLVDQSAMVITSLGTILLSARRGRVALLLLLGAVGRLHGACRGPAAHGVAAVATIGRVAVGRHVGLRVAPITGPHGVATLLHVLLIVTTLDTHTATAS
jgi:hypothetical protein